MSKVVEGQLQLMLHIVVGLGACWHVRHSMQISMLETCWCSKMGVLALLISVSLPSFKIPYLQHMRIVYQYSKLRLPESSCSM
jgi:hypothetical protein